MLLHNKSVKIYFGEKCRKFLIEKIRNSIIKLVGHIDGVDFNGDDSFIPHVSILSSYKSYNLSEDKIPSVCNCISNFSEVQIPNFRIKSINMLLPRCVSFKSVKQQNITEKARCLSVNLY